MVSITQHLIAPWPCLTPSPHSYALFFASRGAKIVVNDVSEKAANAVVEEIRSNGGQALANTSSVTNGAEVIRTAVEGFGAVHILINNAGILRDK